MANLELEPVEVVALVKLLNAVPSTSLMTMNDKGELTFIENLPGVDTLGIKIGALSEDPEVKAYIAEHYE